MLDATTASDAAAGLDATIVASPDATAEHDAAGDADPDGQQADTGSTAARELFVRPDGLDDNPGTQAAPLRTIAKAASLAGSGDTIVLLPGSYDDKTQPTFASRQTREIDIADGVAIRAQTPGAAILSARKTMLFRFLGSGSVRGLVIRGFAEAITASKGELTIAETRFESCGTIPETGSMSFRVPIELRGTVRATVTPPADDLLVQGPDQHGFARLEDSAEIVVTGGTLRGVLTTGTVCDALFRASSNTKVVLDHLNIIDNSQNAVAALGAEVLIRDTSIFNTFGRSSCYSSIVLAGSTRVTLERSSVSNSTDASGILVRGTGQATLTLIDSSVRRHVYGLSVEENASVDVIATGSHFDENGSAGIRYRGRGSLDLTRSTVDRNQYLGMQLDAGEGRVLNVKLRDSSVQGNVWDGIKLQLDAASVVDFGTLAQPGGNTFLGNGARGGDFAAISSEMPAGARVDAVGNIWTANEQSAGADGTYAASGAGAVLEYTGPVTTGKNFRLWTAGAVLRVAQNP